MKLSDDYIRDILKVCIFELAEKTECSIHRPSLLYKTHHGHLHCGLDSQTCTIGASMAPEGNFATHRNGWKTVRCWI